MDAASNQILSTVTKHSSKEYSVKFSIQIKAQDLNKSSFHNPLDQLTNHRLPLFLLQETNLPEAKSNQQVQFIIT